MGIAAGATSFGTDHAVGLVGMVYHCRFVHWFPETGPACAGVKFRLRTEERLPATDTCIRAWIFRLPVFAAECRFRSRLASYLILFGRKLFLPLRLLLFYFFRHDLLRIAGC